MKPYKFVYEAPAHFILHDGKEHFHVAKQGLDKGTVEKIKALPGYSDGGQVAAPKDSKEDAQESMRKAFHFAEGGEVKDSGSMSALKTIFRKSFKAPNEQVVQETQEERNERVRKQNAANFGYAEGGQVEPVMTPMEPVQQVVPVENAAPVSPEVEQEARRLAINAGVNIPATGEVTNNADLASFRQEAQQKVAPAQSPVSSIAQEGANTTAVVPVQEQVTFKPAPQANIPVRSVSAFENALNQEKQGIQENAQAQSEGSKENAANIQHFLESEKQRQEITRAHLAKLEEQTQNLYDDARNNKIDPNRFWNNKSTGSKIRSVLSVIFGGVGSGLSGQPNMAAEYIDRAIKADIEAQKEDKSGTMSLYRAGMERYKDAQSAAQFATLQANALLQGQIQATAAKIGSPQALALAKQATAELEIRNAPIKQELALKEMTLNYKSPNANGVDPQKLRLSINSGIIPKDMQASAMKEYGEYSKLSNLLDQTDKVFKTGYDNANLTQQYLPHALPSIRQSTRNYESTVNSFLDKMTKDLEGRVTPQTMENLRSSMPRIGDNDKVKQQKINDIKDIIKGAASFPTLQSYGLISTHDPISTSSGTRSKNIQESAPVIK